MEQNYPIIGQIVFFSGRHNPENWMYCEGQTLQISEYPALFAVLSYDYGPPSSDNTFKLPDLREIEPKKGTPGYGLRYIILVNTPFTQ